MPLSEADISQIELNIDRWKTGTHVPYDLDINTDSVVYSRNLKNLEAFRDTKYKRFVKLETYYTDLCL